MQSWESVIYTITVRRPHEPDFRKVITLRNGAVRSKQNLSNAHEFVVCEFPKHSQISRALLSLYFRCLLPIS